MIQVLVVFANPKGTDALRLGAEDKTIRECIARSRNPDNLRVDIRHAATIHDFRRALLEQPYQLIHLSGYGTSKGLAFENELGEKQIVPPEALAELIRAYSPPIDCVLLNACYTHEQGIMISLGVPYTIAMDGPISDPAAIEFVRGFYDAIAVGRSIEFAYQEGCRTVKTAGFDESSIPIILKSRLEEIKGFFRTYFPQLCEDTSSSIPSWLRGNILGVFQTSLEYARFSKSGRFTTRHILLALLKSKDSIAFDAVSHLGGKVDELIKEIENNIEWESQPAPKVMLTKSVKDLIMDLEVALSTGKPQEFDDGRILETMINLTPESVTISELLKDIHCEREQLIQTIIEVRDGRMKTPQRK
jgi:hypothetical protein